MSAKAASSTVSLLVVVVCATPTATAPAQDENVYDSRPVLLTRVAPVYPDAARSAKVEGDVMLLVRVQTDGTTSFIRIIKSLDDGCDRRAIEAAEKWTWQPARKDDETVPASGVITLRFPPDEERSR